MKVNEARILGLIIGFFLGYSPEFTALTQQIKILNLTLGLAFIIFGHRVTGSRGGLLYGWA